MIKKISILLIFFISIGVPSFASKSIMVSEPATVGKMIFELVLYLIIFIAVIFLSLYGTKLIAKNYKGMGSSKYMKIKDMINLPNNAKLSLVELNNKIYVILTSNNNNSVVDIIESNDLPAEPEEFNKYLDKYMDISKIGKKIRNINKNKEGKNNEEKY